MDIVLGSVDVINKECISGEDVINVFKDSLVGHIKDDYEIITSFPISFRVDDKENIKDPKGMKGSLLEVKTVISSVSKEPLYKILEVLKLSGVDAVDVGYCSTGDYYTVRSKRIDSLVGAVINIESVVVIFLFLIKVFK